MDHYVYRPLLCIVHVYIYQSTRWDPRVDVTHIAIILKLIYEPLYNGFKSTASLNLDFRFLLHVFQFIIFCFAPRQHLPTTGVFDVF